LALLVRNKVIAPRPVFASKHSTVSQTVIVPNIVAQDRCPARQMRFVEP